MVTGIGTMQATAPTIMNGNISNGVEPVKRASDNRRSNKPIMEKRRRARINNCLNELKTLILDATKKDPARHSKLEKADILEKTVKYLQDLQRQQSAMSQAADPSIVNKFKAGFSECAKEVDRFHGIEPVVKRRLLQHLSSYLTGVKSEHPPQLQQVQIHMLPSSPPGSPEQDQQMLHPQQQQIIQLTPANGCYIKLPNGLLTYVTPQQMQHVPPCAMPTLVPIPSRTSSTASAASNQSSEPRQSPICYAPPSPANSYEAMDYHATPNTTPTPTSNHHHLMNQQHSVVQMQRHADRQQEQQQPQRSYSPVPLSLVMKKDVQVDEEDERKRRGTWRPW
ncbi:Protein hairy [Pseudolycoriella hygida]|uniref:Protein hairy n=1 Tax=Pseudolycoriella hygida TaxID=35572 RepID=A0A9Q0N5I2_9DIPT|nr:Protein hairy [Pseudolycoriella hygida]